MVPLAQWETSSRPFSKSRAAAIWIGTLAKDKTWVLFLLLILSTIPARLVWMSASLWLDEAWVANSIQTPSIHGMLYYDQWAQSTPVLLLLLEWGISAVLGATEITLRIIPWMGALIATLLFAGGIRRLFSLHVAVLGVALFSLNYWGIKYAQQVKPYGTDLLVSALFFWLICAGCRHTLTQAKRVLAMFSVIVLCFLSSQSVFWFPSLAFAITFAPLDSVNTGSERQLFTFARTLRFNASLLLFAAMMATNYFLFVRPNHPELVARNWETVYGAYLTKWHRVPRLIDTIGNLIVPHSSSVGKLLPLTIVMLAVAGAIRVLYILRRGDPRGLPLLLAGPLPLVAGLAASVLHQYPVLDFPRILIWMLPGLYALICVAIEPMLSRIVTSLRVQPETVLAGITGVCLIASAATYSVMKRSGKEVEQNRAMFQKLQRMATPTDCLFVHGTVAEQFELYRRWLHWNPQCVYIGNANWPCCAIHIQDRSSNSSATNLEEDVSGAIEHLHPHRLWIIIEGGAPKGWSTMPPKMINKLPVTLQDASCVTQWKWQYGINMLLRADCDSKFKHTAGS